MFQTIFVEKTKHTFCGQYICLCIGVAGGDHRAVYELIWKNIVELDQYGACALHAGRLSLRTPAQNM